MWAFVLGAIGVIAGCGRYHFDPLVAGDAGSLDAGDAGDVDANSGVNSVTYTAAIAECIDPGSPDPAFCRTANGVTELPVDLDDDTLGVPFHSYLRFDFDQAIAGREITAVTLRLVVTDGAQSNGPSSGEVWRVATFTATDLEALAPAKLGNTPIAGDQGAVIQLQEVTWSLPVPIIDEGALCLGLFPLAADGVNYWSLQGAEPPHLRIDMR